MKGFVNFGKRGVQLPAGCKDLVDVLLPTKSPCGAEQGFRSSERLANHVSKLLESEVKSRTLIITWNEMNYFQLMYDRGALLAFLIVHENTNREQPIRDFFHSLG